MHGRIQFWESMPLFFSSMVTKFYQHALALAFAVNVINEAPRISPNVSFGFHICDSYYDERMTYRSTLDLLYKSQRFVPNYECGAQKNTRATIGGWSSDLSVHMADLLGLYKIPQVRPLPGAGSRSRGCCWFC